MPNADKLMFRRADFPVRLYEDVSTTGKKFYSIGKVHLPPYHPSMADGIDVGLAVSVLDEALENFALDLQEMSEKRQSEKLLIDSLRRSNSHGKPVEEANGKMVEPFPVLGRLYIGRKMINHLGYNGDCSIAIDCNIKPPSFCVPLNVEFSEDVMREYGMKDAGLWFTDQKQIECPYLFRPHNVPEIFMIFYRNLVIALDNAVVRRKYSSSSR